MRMLTPLLLGLLVLVTGCQKQDDASRTGLIYCADGAPRSFNPQLANSEATLDASARPLYDRLLEVNANTLGIEGGLATRWQSSEDGLSYTLTLRKGGRPDVPGRQIVSPETSLTMLDLMRRNVVRGSGGRAEAPGLRVGGKTGSANKSVNGRYNTAHAVGTARALQEHEESGAFAALAMSLMGVATAVFLPLVVALLV